MKTPTRLAIETALINRPTDGPWSLQKATEADETAHGISAGCGTAVSWWSDLTDEGIQKLEDAEYIVACDPANMRQLLQEHDTEVAKLTEQVRVLREVLSNAVAVYDKNLTGHIVSDAFVKARAALNQSPKE